MSDYFQTLPNTKSLTLKQYQNRKNKIERQSPKKQIITSFSNKKQHLSSDSNLNRIKSHFSPKQFYKNSPQTPYLSSKQQKHKKQIISTNIIASIQDKQFQIKNLKEKNKVFSYKIDILEKQNQELKIKIYQLEAQTSRKNYGKQQHQYFKIKKFQPILDIDEQERLLKLLKNTSQYMYFAKLSLLDQGISFLQYPFAINKQAALNFDSNRKNIHFCSCNKNSIPQPYFWVPRNIYEFGKDFIKDRSSELTPCQYELLLYELNRLWRQREKGIINSLQEQKTRQIAKYRRKLDNIKKQKIKQEE